MAGKPDQHNVALGKAVRKLRKKAGLTQRQLSDTAQVPVSDLRLIERGGVEADWGMIRHLAKGMKVQLAEVFRLTEELKEG